MDPALIALLRLRFRSVARRSFRNIRTPRGILFFLLGLAALALLIGPSLVAAAVGRTHHNPELLRNVLPAALLAFTLMSLLTGTREEGIRFSAAEVDFLFSGPFSRRQLLYYKLASGAGGSLLVSLFISVALLQYGSSWLAAFIGTCLAVNFMQLLTVGLALAGQRLGQSLYTRVRKLAVLAIVVLLVVLAARWLPVAMDQGPVEAVRRLRSSTAGFWLLAPLEPFSRAITAHRLLPDLLGWAGLALAVDAALLLLVVRIDVNYLEASLAASQRRYRQLQQQRRSGRVSSRPRVAWSAPALGWLGGAGPIAWRQMTIAVRGAVGLLTLLLILLPATLVPLLTARSHASDMTNVLLGQVCFVTMFLTRAVAFDFRGELDAMDWLKSLPLRSWAIALGELATPVILMTLTHLVLLCSAAVVLGSPWIVVAAGFSLPFNLLLFGVDNFLFLLFPVRTVASTPGDLQHVGRMMIETLAKLAIVMLAAGLAAAVGLAGYWMSAQAWPVALGLAWITLAAAAGLTIPCIAWAFDRFDVSIDTPA